MNRRMWKLLAIGLFFAILPSCMLIFTEPVFRYSGEHVDLEAVAIHSLPGVESRSSNKIVLIDTDEYGRRMFVSCIQTPWLGWGWGDEPADVYALLITQRTENDLVYFYGEQNYLLAFLPKDTSFSADLVQECFLEEEIATLKQRNLWNEAFPNPDPNLCAVPVDVEKSEDMTKASKMMVEKRIGNTNLRVEVLRKDANGKSMHFILSIEGDNPTEYIMYIAMLDANGDIVNGEDGLMKLDRSENISEQILKFRTENGWVNQ